MTKKQANDIETICYFMPDVLKDIPITDADIEKFLEYSERGLHKDGATTGAMVSKHNGFTALCEGKRWRGIHIHEIYEQGVLDGSMPYFTILGGHDLTIKRKWWQFWKPRFSFKHNPMPRSVVDFLKKEMFQGVDADEIERCYQFILEDRYRLHY